MSDTIPHRTGFLNTLKQFLGGGRTLLEQKAQMEALLNAVPGEYCGWSSHKDMIFSHGLLPLLELDTLKTIDDIQHILDPGDAAALVGAFDRLQTTGQPFELDVKHAISDKYFRIRGIRGQSDDPGARFDILWFEDRTKDHQAHKETHSLKEELEDNYDQLQAILDLLPLPLWTRDEEAKISWCNKTYAEILGTTPATVLAEQKDLPVKSPSKSSKDAAKKLAQGGLSSKEAHDVLGYLIINGKRHMMKLSEMKLPQNKQSLGLAVDITREEELVTEQRRYAEANKELLEQLGSAVGIFDADQRLEFYNTAFSQLWHLEDSYLNSRPRLGDIMEKLRETRRLPEQADFRRFKQGWLDMFTSLLAPTEDMLYLPDGTAVRMLNIPHPLGGIMMSFEDVTSRLELESSYNTLIAVQRETLDNLTEGVSVYGGDGRLKLWNPSFAKLWQLSPETLEGEPHITRLAEKMKKRVDERAKKEIYDDIVAQALNRKARSGRIECKDGTLLSYGTVPLPDGGVLVTHVDHTDTVRVENALREKNEALQAGEKLKLDFLANVSYQLRTPLNAIMGFTEILDNEYFGTLNDRQKEYTKSLHDAGVRLLHLINDILDLSTIEAGYMSIEKQDVAVMPMLEALMDLTNDWARKENLHIKLECPKNIGSVQADERRLKQAMLNLIRNAINYTPAEGRITLIAKRTKEALLLSVQDTGPGIPREEIQRIFAPFERITNDNEGTNVEAESVRKREGAGLGLTLVKNIIELHEGTITIDSKPGEGTVATISLPI